MQSGHDVGSDILDASMDALITADRDGHVLRWNSAAERMFGYTAAQVIGRELGETIVPAELRSAHRSGLHSLAGGGRPRIPGGRTETVGQRADGTVFPVELTVTRATDPDGATIFVGFLRDITERHQMLADLRDSRERLLQVSDETRRRFERDLHDGAQQQLVALAIALGSARAKLGTDPAAARDLVDRSITMASTAIDELRELARGVHSAVLTERGLGAALAQLAGRSPIDVTLDVQAFDRLPGTVETSIYYLVTEATTNATKYGARRVAVALRTESSEPGGVRVHGSVSDDGPGGADPGRGTGLLGIADRLAALGGSVDIVSPPGEGTVIRFQVSVGAGPAASATGVRPVQRAAVASYVDPSTA